MITNPWFQSDHIKRLSRYIARLIFVITAEVINNLQPNLIIEINELCNQAVIAFKTVTFVQNNHIKFLLLYSKVKKIVISGFPS